MSTDIAGAILRHIHPCETCQPCQPCQLCFLPLTVKLRSADMEDYGLVFCDYSNVIYDWTSMMTKVDRSSSQSKDVSGTTV
jgi:hypothetical protein